MEWLTDFNIYLQGLILSAIIVGTLIFTVSILYLFNVKLNQKYLKYVYSFSSGFLIITAIVGQFVTARSNITHHWENINSLANPNSDPDPTGSQTMASIGILLGGIVFGTVGAYFMRRMSSHEHVHTEGQHQDSSHEKHGSPALATREYIMHESKVHKEKTPVIYMILAHRIPAGLLLGILLVNFNNGGEYSLAALLVFILHTIPDMAIIYFARIKAGHSRKNSFIFSVLVKLILIPFILLGVVISENINVDSDATFWIIPFLMVAAGIVMTWGAIFELAPAFINTENKEIYKVIFVFIAGLAASMAIQMVHHH